MQNKEQYNTIWAEHKMDLVGKHENTDVGCCCTYKQIQDIPPWKH